MSNNIYTIHKQLNEILNISGYTMPDDELFDCSDYPNDGKTGGRFDWTGMKLTKTHRENIRRGNIGLKRSAEFKTKLSKQRKGVSWDDYIKDPKKVEERKKKLRERRTGTKHSEATKKKMSEARKQYYKERK